MRTLPDIAAELRAPVDSLRRMIRKDARLRAIGTRFGCTRVFDANDQAEIQAAWEALKAKRQPA